ncbi:cyclin-domain-containing protein, partial [Globomyces pollinis-pini]
MVFDLKFPPQETIKLLANYLSFIVLKNDQRSDTQRNLTRFHARTIPSIDIVGYLTRILKYAPCGTECELELKLEGTFITKNSNPIVIDSFNIHRLIISAALVSIKFLSDVFYTNLHISRVGGVPVVELNQLELEFLKRCNFNLMVTPMEL